MYSECVYKDRSWAETSIRMSYCVTLRCNTNISHHTGTSSSTWIQFGWNKRRHRILAMRAQVDEVLLLFSSFSE